MTKSFCTLPEGARDCSDHKCEGCGWDSKEVRRRKLLPFSKITTHDGKTVRFKFIKKIKGGKR